MQCENDTIMKNGTWSLCNLSLGKKAIGTKWVQKFKCKLDGSRLVAKSYAQENGIDYVT